MRKSKILIVDDRKFDRILYKEYLQVDHYEFSELNNGKLIIETLKSFEPLLILLDWQMPGMGGPRDHRRNKKVPHI